MNTHDANQPPKVSMRALRSGRLGRDATGKTRGPQASQIIQDIDAAIAAAREQGSLVIGYSLALRPLSLAQWGPNEGPSQDALASAVRDRLANVDERIVSAPGQINRVSGFMHKIERRSEADHLAGEMLLAVRRPFFIDGGTYHFAARLGLDLLSETTQRGAELIDAAELALVDTDDVTPLGWYNGRLGTRHTRETAIIEALAESLTGAGPVPGPDLAFDATIDRARRRMTGLDALVRWSHPELGEIGRPELLRLAEQSGLITELGRHVFTKAMGIAGDLARRDLFGDVTLWVNFTAIELMDPDFRTMIRNERSRYPDVSFGIQIREGHALREKAVSDTIRALAFDDVKASVSNFGGDFSALSELVHLPFDTVKLNHDLVRVAATSTDDRSILQLIVELTNRHDLVLVAPGIETQGQLDAIEALGIQQVQGHRISNTMTPEQVLAVLTPSNRSRSSRPGE